MVVFEDLVLLQKNQEEQVDLYKMLCFALLCFAGWLGVFSGVGIAMCQ